MESTDSSCLASSLLRAQDMTDTETQELLETLLRNTVKELNALAKRVSVRLAGSSRKADIVERLLAMAKIGAVQETLSTSASEDFTGISYITDEVRAILSKLPPFKTVTTWKKELKGILNEFTFMNLLIYLVYGRDKSFDMKSLKAFKSLKAYKYFYDGFVRNAWVHECVVPASTSLRVLYFRAFVHHSLTCESPLTVFVSVNGDNGHVYSAKCDCVSGLGQACSHVAALLFFIEHHAGKEKLPTETSNTSQPMTWNQPPKKVITPACANEMTFVKPSHTDLKDTCIKKSLRRSEFDPRLPTHRTLEKDSVTNLITGIRTSIPNTGLLQFWESNDASTSIPQEPSTGSLWSHVIFCSENAAMVDRTYFDPSVQQCYEYMNSLKLSQTEVERIEFATRGQTSNKLWSALHNGRITSSMFGKILHRRASTNPNNLVKRIMGYRRKESVHLPPQLRWGRDNEPIACKCYLEDRNKVGEAMSFEPTGLYLLPEKSYLGASSDGKLTCTSVDTCCVGCLEIKCPYSIDGTSTINLTPDEIAEKYGRKFFMERGDDSLLHLPKKHRYYAQVQGEMAILNVEWCDFVVYSKGVVAVDRILADYNYWTELTDILDSFYVQYVVPEILSGSLLKRNAI